MNTQPIICQGDELESVIAGIRARGGVVTALSTGVGGHNASYGVSYFGCVAENTDAGAGSSRIPVRQLTAHAGENPVATNHLDAVNRPTTSAGKSPRGSDQVTPEELRAENLQSGVERQIESRVEDRQQHPNSILDSDSSQETPLVISAVLPTSPVSGKDGQGESRSCDAASMAVGRTGRNPDISIETPLPHCPTCSGPVTQGMACPICAGLERIKAGARRLRNRFQSSTTEARIPYAD